MTSQNCNEDLLVQVRFMCCHKISGEFEWPCHQYTHVKCVLRKKMAQIKMSWSNKCTNSTIGYIMVNNVFVSITIQHYIYNLYQMPIL